MPGDANAAERGWLRTLIAGLAAVQTLLLAHEAAGGQSQSQIPVSAYVVVSSTITATMSATPAASSGAPSSAPTTNTAAAGSAAAATPANQAARPQQQLCTQVAVSCSGRAPMRVSVDDGDSSGDVQECAAQRENTVSLCATGANGPHGSLGLNIEY